MVYLPEDAVNACKASALGRYTDGLVRDSEVVAQRNGVCELLAFGNNQSRPARSDAVSYSPRNRPDPY